MRAWYGTVRVDGRAVEIRRAWLHVKTMPEWRHVAVRQNLRESDTFSQIQTAYHADAADVRPRLPLVGAQMQLAARYLCVQKRRPGSVVGNFAMVRKSAFFAIHASVAF